jgi:hypothetical protein
MRARSHVHPPATTFFPSSTPLPTLTSSPADAEATVKAKTRAKKGFMVGGERMGERVEKKKRAVVLTLEFFCQTKYLTPTDPLPILLAGVMKDVFLLFTQSFIRLWARF